MEHAAPVNGLVIRPAQWPADEGAAQQLLRNYADFLLRNPNGPVNICLVDYEAELAALATRYQEPNAVILLAFLDATPAGCVAVKQRPDRPGSCEMKRLWTEPMARGRRLGRLLTEAAIAWARKAASHTLLLDTVPTAMPQAAQLYRDLGFLETARHNENPVDGLQFMELRLR